MVTAAQHVAAAACVPEWCETGGPPHDDTCPNHAMEPMTKQGFVDFTETAADQAIDAYVFLIEDGMSPEDAKEFAKGEVIEASVCYAGIGSCGRGCLHS